MNSPSYSYLAAMRADEVATARGLRLEWRPFLLGPIFAAQGLSTSPFNLYPLKGAYMWRDIERIAAARDLPFRRPEAFPQHTVLASRLAMVCEKAGCLPAFSRRVFRSEFADGLWIDDDEVLRQIVGSLGLPVEETMERAVSPEIKEKLRVRTDEATRLGIFGAPTFITGDGELFWGDDRMEYAFEWASNLV